MLKEKLIIFFCFVFGLLHGQNVAVDSSLANARKGDIVTINGHKAIVFQTYGNGHGKAMYVNALRGVRKSWCKTNAIKNLRTTDKENGRANTEAIFMFVEEKGLDINDFPAAAWCRQLGPGWYIPSIRELEVFINWWLGNDVDDAIEDEVNNPKILETSFSKQVNKKLLDVGGIPFINGAALSSTENEKGRLSFCHYNESKNFWGHRTVAKTNVRIGILVRAFIEF